MKLYFAPMEGVTDTLYRQTHHDHFSGIDRYYIPFISPTQNLVLTPRELRNVDPQANAGLHAVPQVLTKKADHFLWAAYQLHDLGYDEVNLNVGCPSGTVTTKGKGSGMLLHLEDLEAFLDEVFAHTPVRISIKTRIGFTTADSFEDILALYSRYPVHELTIHPRTREEYYTGHAHRDIYTTAESTTSLPLVYNGDLFDVEDCRSFSTEHPRTHALMLGRGLLTNPALAQELAGGKPLTQDALRAFHDDLFDRYMQAYPISAVLGRMREVAKNMACGFENADKPLKAVRKANSLRNYQEAIDHLFGDYRLSDVPRFSAKS